MNPFLRVPLLVLISPIIGFAVLLLGVILLFGNLVAVLDGIIDDEPIDWFTVKDLR
jgi:hypothetical protein